MNLQLDLSTLLNLFGVVGGAVAIVVGLRAKLESIRAIIQVEMNQLNETVGRMLKNLEAHDLKLDCHEKDIQELKWRTRPNGGSPRV